MDAPPKEEALKVAARTVAFQASPAFVWAVILGGLALFFLYRSFSHKLPSLPRPPTASKQGVVADLQADECLRASRELLLEKIAKENELVMQRKRELEQKKKIEEEVKLKGKQAFKTRRLGSTEDPLEPLLFPPSPPPAPSSSFSSSSSFAPSARRFDPFRRNGGRKRG
eukprot:TRINITY_DN4296_c0_g1_i1.p1 TRINITY_DN4296_c0_g1~~TRINITY_DN4296_c0_g1_i1.p1  ORF type:complete len:169 (+),score=67.43 TRINITY_DN4296_c0_g1_i1:71-577(+)